MIEYILGFGLQSFGVILGIYVFNRQKVILKNYLLSGMLLMILSSLVRLLPISIGVHTIINMLFTYLICVILLKMPAYTTIRSTSLCVVLILICEMIVTGTMTKIIGLKQFKIFIKDNIHRLYVGVLANAIFVLVIIILYIIFKKKGDSHRNISSQDS